MGRLVSIIIPAWQASETLPFTLQSIFSQDYVDKEVIVIDDASTDNLKEAIAPWLDRVIFRRLPENSGPQKTRNAGFREAHGDYLIFCDADLVYLDKSAISKLVQTLE
ncbi:MAG: glycosyltransferase family 2 protein, partial [bacterium]